MTLTEYGYKPRLIDKKIKKYMSLFGALSIEGPKWCGKTWTALNHAKSVVYLLDPENDYANREAARLDPASILTGQKPLLVDEWQEVPGIWDAVRFASDRTKEKGLYLLTGSVTPAKGSFSHSGAGRIGKIRMRTMSLYESGDSSGMISLAGLFDGERINPNSSKLTQDKLICLSIRGGWPENIASQNDVAGILPEQYISALAETDISHADNTKPQTGFASTCCHRTDKCDHRKNQYDNCRCPVTFWRHHKTNCIRLSLGIIAIVRRRGSSPVVSRA
jgi:predicted AAA+ superfamily ATPase